MAMSPSGIRLEAPGIRAIACSSVSVRNCKGLSLAGLCLGGIRVPKETAGPYSPVVFGKSSQIVLVPVPAAMPATAMPAMVAAIATKTEPEGDRGTIIVRVPVGIRSVIISRRRRRVGTRRRIGARRICPGWRRWRFGIRRIVRILALAHAGVISLCIVPLDVAGRMLRIGGPDRGAGQKASPGANRSARTDMARSAADDSAQSRAAERATHGAVGLRMAGRLARRHVARARRGVTAAVKIARTRVWLRI